MKNTTPTRMNHHQLWILTGALLFFIVFTVGCSSDSNPGSDLNFRPDPITPPQTTPGTIVAPVPTISGTFEVGNMIQANAGVWQPADVRLAFQWLRNDVTIPDATSSSYFLTYADVNALLAVRVVGTRDGYSTQQVTSSQVRIDNRSYTGNLAVDWVKAQMETMDTKLYIYHDFSNGLNNFTQRMWMGETISDPPRMNEKATPAYAGVSAVKASIDFTKHRWGGYGLQNGILEPDKHDPILNYGDYDAGLDLTGATTLHFWARGEEGGESIRFFVGGLGHGEGMLYLDSIPVIDRGGDGFVTLTKEWQHYTIDVSGRDLSRVANGFGWVTSFDRNPGRNSIAFYFDEVYYEFASPRSGPFFITSYEAKPLDDDEAFINGFAYTYDQAVAAILLSNHGDHARAAQIADGLVYALNHDRYYRDGRLRNAYANGDPRSFPGWQTTDDQGNPVREFAKLPGFYMEEDGQQWLEDVYAGSTSAGNQAWAILALLDVYENGGRNSVYLSAAVRAADFICDNLADESEGFLGGYIGWEGTSTKVGYKSTEHNIDLIAVFTRLAHLVGESTDTVLAAKAAQYEYAAASAREFVFSQMYNIDLGLFYTGTIGSGDNPLSPNEIYPLDTNTWALLVNPHFEHRDTIMSNVENTFGNPSLGGYDFNTDRDGMWWEGTGQVATVYQTIGDRISTINAISILDTMNANALNDGSITAASRDGLTTGFKVEGTDQDWLYGRRGHLGATCWLGFAQLGINPLRHE